MNIFFDVDQTLLHSEATQWHLRPGVHEIFESLKSMGHILYIWTASGEMHARRLVDRYDLHQYVSDCFDKDPVTAPLLPDVVVDDDAYLVEKYTGVLVEQYNAPDPSDRELYRVLEIFQNGGIQKS
ncbi:MAG: NIF family HAD-type phosphatase [SAR202 cluster bacterium]|jgi:hypothetical protein|nr:NIF family HAD-type phosphatase [SAR202 cluster bacterium]MDP6716039.1 NIF family HAD-type phosphatase [SAR202 cluster bacterium]